MENMHRSSKNIEKPLPDCRIVAALSTLGRGRPLYFAFDKQLISANAQQRGTETEA
jgi:hypothetical protein